MEEARGPNSPVERSQVAGQLIRKNQTQMNHHVPTHFPPGRHLSSLQAKDPRLSHQPIPKHVSLEMLPPLVVSG